ncbi:hypothetical protein CYMTET_18315 [Cymbomonas tetramitiformis]|uniref:Histidine phosphatase family protein n=1 Tax=Cymbomonas tetramitiformis TaxID=36881 RepID=A0AAE0G8A4_9CHLO|nr:hypothetical protein CYMTET_18315 [Cymbomonas tetramitiformis]
MRGEQISAGLLVTTLGVGVVGTLAYWYWAKQFKATGLHQATIKRAKQSKPQARDKTVYLIRHGQSTFNAEYAKTEVDPFLFDAPLSQLGEVQVAELANSWEQRKGREALPEIVFASPLTRALQTAAGGLAPLGVEVRVEPLLREHLTDSCDIGRTPVELAKEFPALSFSHLDEIWWYIDPEADEPLSTVKACQDVFIKYGYMEPLRVLEARLDSLIDMLAARPECTIALVGHGDFMNALAERIDPSETDLWLDNCEVAKVQLICVQ